VTDYNFLDDVPPKPPVQPPSEPSRPSETEIELTVFDQKLIQILRNRRVLSLATGSLDRTIQRAAQEHADFQARADRMGHQNWKQRSDQLFAELTAYTGFREVAALSGHPDDQAAEMLFEAWKNSPDHWVWVNGHCDFYGYAMAKSASGRWYGCGIFADRKH
jgi:uncharacterized protein YkwD